MLHSENTITLVKGKIEEQHVVSPGRQHASASGSAPAVLSSSYEGAWGKTKSWRGALSRFKSAGRKAMKLKELTPLEHARRLAGAKVWRLYTPEEKSMALARSLEILETAEDEGKEELEMLSEPAAAAITPSLP